MLKLAEDDGRLPVDPAQRLKPPKRIKTAERYLIHDEVADNGYQHSEAPKDYGHRSIPIPEFLVAMLEEQVSGRRGSQPVFFGMRTTTYLRNHAFRKGWFDLAAAAMTLYTYADLFDDDLDNVASALNELALKSDVQLLMT